MPEKRDRTEVKIGVSVRGLISAINELDTEDREFLIENLLAATSPDYIYSVEEARVDYRHGRVLPHDKVFSEGGKRRAGNAEREARKGESGSGERGM